MKRTRYFVYACRLLLAAPLFILFLLFGEQTEKVLNSLANTFTRNPIL